MERYESLTKEELLKELKWLLGQQDMIQEEYRSLQSQCADLAGEHRALEDAYKLKEEEAQQLRQECEALRRTLILERRQHAQGDTLKHLSWMKTEAKGRTWCVITACSPDAERIVVPETIEGVPVIGVDTGAFSDCVKLREVDLPYGVRAVAEETFQRCTSLTRAVIPRSVIYMGKTAFEGCSPELVFEGDTGSYVEWFASYHGFGFEAQKVPCTEEKFEQAD